MTRKGYLRTAIAAAVLRIKAALHSFYGGLYGASMSAYEGVRRAVRNSTVPARTKPPRNWSGSGRWHFFKKNLI